jgi:hypothetical protein
LGLAAAGVLLPVAVSGSVVAHAATATATASNVAAGQVAASNVAAVTVGASGAAPMLAQSSLAAVLGAASTTTQALLAAALLAVGGAGVAAFVSAPSPQPQSAAQNVRSGTSTTPVLEASGPPRKSEPEAKPLPQPQLSEPAAVALGSPTRSHQSAVGSPRVASVPETFTQNGNPTRPAAPAVASADSASALIDLELATVRETHAALARGDGALAQQLLSNLDRTVPRGALAPERRVCAVLAACQLQQQQRALQLTTQLLSSDGDFYRQRLAASCVSELLK